ncbi:cytochrome P460 family protein [Phenylobacterium sp.]|uniref:cytochrome P460 family protein n=1 Tax=Phenylobacterium sp. TaxID=1871053 RepID=UPI0025DA7357|nr:cytochrome P460 family protein [Phenylobacterium sp.]
MIRQTAILFGVGAIALAGMLAAAATSHAQASKPAAVFTADGKLEYPKDYRTWVYLSTGLDMAYTEGGGMANMHMFDNVFVDRAAYDGFLQTGHWPEGTVFMLEVRKGEGRGSINKKGQFQTAVLGREAHVKDKRFKSGWAFFGFNGESPGHEQPQTSECNACHEQHAAVDTTFVQFYPTLKPVAEAKKTFSAAYLAEEKAR